MAFVGFPKQTFQFLDGLARNNAKPWFEAHRDEYERFYIAPAREFVAAIGPQLQKMAPGVNFEPKVNGSIFRINRDARFSKDKTPYKAHLDLWFWQGNERGWNTPGYFMRLTASELVIGAGMHRFEAKEQAAYRAAVLADASGKKLDKIAAALEGMTLGGATRKTVPRGFDAAHPRARFLLHEGLFALHEGPLPKSVHGAAFVAECLAYFRKGRPVAAWLAEFVAA